MVGAKLGITARVILDTGDAKKTFRITDPKKIEVSGGTTDLACGSQPQTPLRVEYSQSDAPQVDGEVRALYFEK
jgi:hypothetical protein